MASDQENAVLGRMPAAVDSSPDTVAGISNQFVRSWRSQCKLNMWELVNKLCLS